MRLAHVGVQCILNSFYVRITVEKVYPMLTIDTSQNEAAGLKVEETNKLKEVWL